jgi:hypothetical protein
MFIFKEAAQRGKVHRTAKNHNIEILTLTAESQLTTPLYFSNNNFFSTMI